MRSAVRVRACFANVFATKLVINRQKGRTGRQREGSPKRARGSGARSKPRSSIRDTYVEQAALASKFARTRLGYREEKRQRLTRGRDAGQGRGIEMIFAREIREMKREFWETG